VLNWGLVDPRSVDPNAAHTAASRDLIAIQFHPDCPNESARPA
jgi:hypothetical protein